MRKRFHGLKRPKVRQDWSRETLYNLSRLTTPFPGEKTYFQQKWAAKALSRAYHGEQIRESQWTRMFNKRIPAVVPMNPLYMARNDGSELASGRGSGQGSVSDKKFEVKPTPYMQMTYFPTERRLDTAIFRSLFASSTRQARQMVVHGWVTVNGKKMRYPGYLLNPGDMFQVEPERVMFATGAKKESPRWLKKQEKLMEKHGIESIESHEQWLAPPIENAAEAEDSEGVPEEATKPAASPEDVKRLLRSAKDILEHSKDDLSGRAKKELRLFRNQVKQVLSKKLPKDASDAAVKTYERNVEDLDVAFQALKVRLFPSTAPGMADAKETSSDQEAENESLLRKALARARENPVDESKSYATPWRPKPYMSAFAFIPRYLEVNPNVCAAVYLRHPVARPGLAEVPTPFAQEMSQLAFNWYLRRR